MSSSNKSKIPIYGKKHTRFYQSSLIKDENTPKILSNDDVLDNKKVKSTQLKISKYEKIYVYCYWISIYKNTFYFLS